MPQLRLIWQTNNGNGITQSRRHPKVNQLRVEPGGHSVCKGGELGRIVTIVAKKPRDQVRCLMVVSTLDFG